MFVHYPDLVFVENGSDEDAAVVADVEDTYYVGIVGSFVDTP